MFQRSSQNKIPAELAEPRKPEAVTNTTMAPQPLNARALQANVNHPHRQAAEDASLDYSYDNMALNLTPSPTTAMTRQPQI